MSTEGYRRRIRGTGPLDLKAHRAKKRDGEILTVAKSPVVTVTPTTPVYDVIRKMAERGFRRLPVVDAGTKHLEGIVTGMDVINYLGGGEKFGIIQQRFGGNFFRAMNEPVKLVMTQRVTSVKASAKISEAILRMKESNVGGLPVVDERNSVRAIITERDVANLFADMTSGIRVAQLMSENVVTALPRTTIFEAERSMVTQGFRRLPIVSDGRVVGLVTAMDVLRFFGCGEAFAHLRSGTIVQVLNNPALEIATRDVMTVEPGLDVGQAAMVMREKNIGALPVVKDDRLVGIISERDFFKIIE